MAKETKEQKAAKTKAANKAKKEIAAERNKVERSHSHPARRRNALKAFDLQQANKQKAAKGQKV